MPALMIRQQSPRSRSRGVSRVALVDSDPTVHALLYNTLAQLNYCSVLDVFPTAQSTSRMCFTPLSYHLIVVDIDMPDLAPPQFIRKLRALSHDVRIVAVTEHVNGPDVFSALTAGTGALLVKPLQHERLLRAIEAPDHHRPFVDEPALSALVVFLQASGPPASFPGLTPRQTEILSCLAQKLSDKDIALRLHIETATVNAHLKNLYRKLHAHGRSDAVQEYLRAGGAR